MGQLEVVGMKVPYNYLPEQFSDPETFFRLWEPLIRSGEFTLGPYVEAFEEKFADFVGSRHCISTNNGTDALILGLKALGIGAGDEVITATNSFYASAGAIAAVGADPVFADVDDRYQIDLASIEQVMSDRVRAIMPVHWAGASPEMAGIVAFADTHDLAVIEDACMGIGGSVDGRHPGTFGAIGAFSMHPLKTVNVMGDGGMVVTDDDDLADWMRKYRNHGMTDRDHIEMWGVNMRLQPLQAVVASRLLDDLPDVVTQRNCNASLLDSELGLLTPHVVVPPRLDGAIETFSLYIIRVEMRDELLAALHRGGVEAKIHYPIPLHLQAASQPYNRRQVSLPRAELQSKSIITLPVHQYLSVAQLQHAIKQVTEFFARSGKVV